MGGELKRTQQSLFRRLKTAFDGLRHTIATEANMRIHLAAAIAVVTAGVALQIDRYEWLAVTICVGFVFAAECFNTSIERLADRVQPDNDPLIGQAKDCAAAAVLCTSIVAVMVGLTVFLPKIWCLIML